MRLIDLDKTVWQLRINEDKYDYDSYYGYTEAIKVVRQQPIVEAIPMEFLVKWFGDNYNALTDLQIAWEKENGKD